MSNLKEYILIGLAALIIVVFGYVGVHSNLAVLNEKISTLSLITAMSSQVKSGGTSITYPAINNSVAQPYGNTGQPTLGNAGDNVTDQQGICTGSEPVSQLCNVNINTLATTGSYDGFVVGNVNWTIATGTAKFVYTNPGVDVMCSGALSSIVASTTSGFTPSIVYAMGTSTSATG